jgi:glycosyltransferase involved in cell wall biosynthesis
MLTVGIDVSPLVQTTAGTARHIAELTAAIEGQGGVSFRRYAFGGSGRPAAAARDVGWYLAGLARAARRDCVDLLHCPTFRAPTRCDVPLVVTVHDLAVLRHPYVFNRWSRSYSARVLPLVARAATAVVAVSEFTRGEIVELLGVPEERVHVVPNGVGPPFVAEGPASEGDYVLAVSTLEPRKNLARLVEGFQLAALDGCELRVAGPSGWGGVRVGGDRVRWLGEVGAEELAGLYRGARCVAYVSLYEGFGLPVLEAMACGTPVVCSDTTALPEAAGGAARLAAPDRVADAVAELLGDDAERERLRQAGLRRAAEFSWDRTARAVDALLSG